MSKGGRIGFGGDRVNNSCTWARSAFTSASTDCGSAAFIDFHIPTLIARYNMFSMYTVGIADINVGIWHRIGSRLIGSWGGGLGEGWLQRVIAKSTHRQQLPERLVMKMGDREQNIKHVSR